MSIVEITEPKSQEVHPEFGPVPAALKPPAGPEALAHRDLRADEWWRRLPAWADVDEATFLDHRWQAKKSVTRVDKLLKIVEGVVSPQFIEDAAEGFRQAPMAVRVSPYLLSLIDWDNPYEDPIRRQFIPVGSKLTPDHPKLGLDSLNEQGDAPTPGLTHRYPDKALFLPLDTCPVYCRFCTRSYAVGLNTENVEKVSLKANKGRWQAAFAYIQSRPELEDIVISGGDAYQLRPDMIRYIGETLLSMPNIRRVRWATKGLAVMPQKVLTDDDWFSAVAETVALGRKRHKEVVIHTHFNHPNEITQISKRALDRLFEAGVTVRNQAVLQRGVNDSIEAMTLLVKRLAYVNVQPYYVYQHDLVKGVEDLRTTVRTAVDIEKHVRGTTAGFNTPTFVVDAPGGGGKRGVHSFEYYDETTGVSVYTAPSVKTDQAFFYFDPVALLPEEGRRRWADPSEHDAIINEALSAIGR
ncbi:MAG: KamA family radical SAM protein [Bradymonadia bacterium]